MINVRLIDARVGNHMIGTATALVVSGWSASSPCTLGSCPMWWCESTGPRYEPGKK